MKKVSSKTDFNRQTTTTDGKLKTIETQIDLVSHYRHALGVDLKGSLYGLPGGAMQVERHISEYKAYSASPKDINLLEIQKNTCNGLKRWQKRNNFKGTVAECDAYVKIGNVLDAGQSAPIIDFDKTMTLSQLDFDLITKAGKNKSNKVFLLTVCVKSKLTKFLKAQKRKFGFRAYKNEASKTGLSNPISKISQAAVIDHAKKCGYIAIPIPYHGHSQMLSFVLLKVKGI